MPSTRDALEGAPSRRRSLRASPPASRPRERPGDRTTRPRHGHTPHEARRSQESETQPHPVRGLASVRHRSSVAQARRPALTGLERSALPRSIRTFTRPTLAGTTVAGPSRLSRRMNLSLLAAQLAVSCLTSTDRALAATRSTSAVAMPRPCQASATATLTSALPDWLTGRQRAIPTVTPSGAKAASASGANRSTLASAGPVKRSSHLSNTNNRAYTVSAPSPAKQLVNQLAIPASSSLASNRITTLDPSRRTSRSTSARDPPSPPPADVNAVPVSERAIRSLSPLFT